MSFVRVPTKWIREGKLDSLSTDNVVELKVYFALLILKGRYQFRLKSEEKSFPATLDEISDCAHVSRPHALEGVRRLRERNLIEIGRPKWKLAGVGHRTTFHRLRGSVKRFFAFPWATVDRSDLLKHLRLNNRVSLNALKVYLLLGAFRDIRTGVSRISHSTMSEYGVGHNVIRPAIDLLISARLVVVHRGDRRGFSNMYVLTGIDTRRKGPQIDDPQIDVPRIDESEIDYSIPF